MSVAEQTPSTSVPSSPQAVLAGYSLAGAGYILACFVLIFGSLPWLWNDLFREVIDQSGRIIHKPALVAIEPFLSGALLLLVTLAVLIVFCLATYRLDQQITVKGHRAGIAVSCLALFLIAWATLGVGNILATRDLGTSISVTIIAIVFAVLTAGYVWLIRTPGFYLMLLSLEEQGWFHAAGFKPNQGFKVRRGTMIGVIALGLCGIITMVQHGSLGTGLSGDNDWLWWLPFTSSIEVDASGAEETYARFIPLLTRIHMTGPLFLAIALLWFSWRLVNWPLFADFLIATEAEINKVSWTTRKRLVQDTIVVLVTVFLLTTFLFVIDIVWIKVLSSPIIDVLKVDVRQVQMQQQEKSQW